MVLHETTLSHRLVLLRTLPLFSLVPDSTLKEISSRFCDTIFEANQIIVTQGDIIDSVYIIVDGEAEVSIQHKFSTNQEPEIIAVLRAGEAIGLSDTGFYSSSGLRTATVKAITSVLAIRLKITDFKKILSKHEQLNVDLLKTTDNILRQQFLKQVEPFQAIDPELSKNLADHLKELSVPAGEIIIEQGDIGNYCYLLISGSVEIILTKTDGNTVLLDTLETSGTLFGETALLTSEKRNATVKAVTECKLYALTREQFLKLTQSFDTSKLLVDLMMDRQRPVRINGVSIHTRHDAERKTIVILKEPKKGIYFKTNEEGLFIWNLLHGDLTIMNIALQYFYRYEMIAIESISSLIMQLMRSGLVEMPVLHMQVKQKKQPYWVQLLKKIEFVLTYSYSIYNVDHKLTRLYNCFGYLFYTKVAHVINALIVITGIVAFIRFLPHMQHILKETPHAWIYLLCMSPASMLIIPLHELAHALTTKAYGRDVNRMGVGWFWLGPMAFTDTSDMWLSTRWPRLAVSFAGIYLNWIISGLLAFIAWLCLPYFPHAAAFIWLVAFSSYMMGYYNLDPTFELDGYYILMNYFDKPNLRAKAVRWLVDDSVNSLSNPRMAGNFIPEITYWGLVVFFLILYIVTALVTYDYIFASLLPLKIHQYSNIIRWVLVAFILFISFTGMYFKIKQQRSSI